MAEDNLDRLLILCGDGNEHAFQELYNLVAPQLLAIAKRILGDHQQAEDALQQSLVHVWRNAADFDPERSQATTWLTSITRYRAIDMLRQRARQQDVLRSDPGSVITVLGHDAAFRTDDPVSAKLAERLAYCFRKIGREQAGCIQLAYLDGLTHAEVSARLHSSIGTVKSRIRRGLDKLRKCVAA